MGKLIVIEGTDASGKQTQTGLLYDYFKKEGKEVMKITFPDYESDTSIFVRKYLGGEFGKSAEDVNPKTASVFYALDRYASYKKNWEEFSKRENTVIIFDRYVTSNMIHQASKINSFDEQDEFCNWLCDFEYNIMGLPKPDKVVFLNMRFDLASKLMEKRNNKIDNSTQKDIHEKDRAYMEKCYNNACRLARKYDWSEVKCYDGDEILSIEAIHKKIKDILK